MTRPPRFPVSIKGVVLDRSGRHVALLQNERHEWELPGGKLERGESLEACLVREVREELDLEVTPGALLDVWVYRVRPDEPDPDVLIVTYGCHAAPFDEIRWTAEHRDGRLVALEEVERLAMPEGYRRSIGAWAAVAGTARSRPEPDGPFRATPARRRRVPCPIARRDSIVVVTRGRAPLHPGGSIAMLDRLLEMRRSHRQAPLPSPPITLDAGYHLQDELRAALVSQGERVIGWKVGLTSRTAQEFMGINHPVSGFLLGDGVYATGDTVPLSRFAELVVEVEVAFIMKRDLAGPGVTAATALLAVEGALPALELPDLRWNGKGTAGDLIADGVAANALVLGQPLTPVAGLDLALEGVLSELSGQRVATSTAAEALGNPVNVLAWLANNLGERDLGLRAGDLVMSGSISALLRPKPGDVVTARFTRLGAVSARFVL